VSERITTPTTQDEWTLHSINIHGIFFERLCQNVVDKSRDWKLISTNYPVEFPPPNGPIRGKESSADIVASRRYGDLSITLTIECKKNNPELVNWVFFPKVVVPPGPWFTVAQIVNRPRPEPQKGWRAETGVLGLTTNEPLTDEARETKSDYEKSKQGLKTKTSNAAIQEAAFQVALARQAVFQEESSFSSSLGSSAEPPETASKQLYVPVIVTTAKLLLCHFNTDDIDSETGEINYTKATLTRVPHLIYEYSLPKSLQHAPANIIHVLKTNSLYQFTRLHILVVNSSAFAAFLDDFFS
jgi:hypothetical protein